MDIKKLLSGIAVVIDDKLDNEENDDLIVEIVDKIKKQDIPLYTDTKIPFDTTCDSLLQSATFVLLDWNLEGSEDTKLLGDTLQTANIEKNIKFLNKAKSHFTPVFILTNEGTDDIKHELYDYKLYDIENPRKNFIFIKEKHRIDIDNIFNPIEEWMRTNASVYTLKAWEQVFYKAKEDFFCSMYEKSPSWPGVFWSCYEKDGVEPSSLIANLINNNVLAHMNTDIFEESVLNEEQDEKDNKDIKSVLEGSIFIPKEKLSKDEIRAGDIFIEDDKYLINIRADCDCIPRKKQKIDEVYLLCIYGKCVNPKECYSDQYGNFEELDSNSIVFGIDEKTIKFRFKELIKKEFKELKDKRIGRLTHPYITRIQQRFASYLQRQGLPRIPKEAID